MSDEHQEPLRHDDPDRRASGRSALPTAPANHTPSPRRQAVDGGPSAEESERRLDRLAQLSQDLEGGYR